MKLPPSIRTITSSLALIFGAHAQAQILNRNDLERELVRNQAATRNTQAMPPLQAGALWSHLGVLYQDEGHYGQAEQAYEHAMRLLTTPPVSASALASTTDALGTLYLQTSNLADAERAETKALHMREQAALNNDLPLSWYHLANLYLRLRQPVKAQVFAERALTALKSDPDASFDIKLGSSLVLASALCQQRNYAEAIERLQTTLLLAQSKAGEDSLSSGMTKFLLGYALFKSGNFAAALEPMGQGSETIGRELGPEHPTFLIVMHNYARLLHADHQRDEAKAIEKRIRETQARLAADPAYTHPLKTLDIAALF